MTTQLSPCAFQFAIILPRYYINKIETLDTIFNKYDTDKNASFHHYTRQYETLLNDFRDKPVKYLEIGVFNGGSVKAMREVFKNGECIVGLDINEQCKMHEDIKNNIFIEIGDATDPHFVNKITEKYGTFDIILDDGSHTNKDVIKSFELLFPLLNDNGVFIVEDTICYKSEGYMIHNYENHLQYFFKYTKFLNQWRYDSTEGVKDHCVDPFKIQKKTTNVFEYSIDKIEYGCSYIAIYKKLESIGLHSLFDF
jgi:23S rRNA U2552 (ribose-2'-O)-methylase RlmE/FtsJ